MKPVLRVYTGRGCHLCDIVKAQLESLKAELGFTIELVGIDDDPELERRYRQELPVVELEGRKIFKYRVDPDRLARILSRRGGSS